MKKYLELMKRIDLIKSINPQDIDSYLIEGSCRIIQYGKNNIVHLLEKSARNLTLFFLAKWLLSVLMSPEIL